MSKNNNIQDSFEKFFKDKLEDYQIDYNQEDWKDLEGRLDYWDKQQARPQWRYIPAAAALLLVSLLGYFTYNNYQSINEVKQQLTTREKASPEPDHSVPLQTLPDTPEQPAQPGAKKAGETTSSNGSSNTTALAYTTDNNSPVAAQNISRITDISQPALRPQSLKTIKHGAPFGNNGLNSERFTPGISGEAAQSIPKGTAHPPVADRSSRFALALSMAPDLSTVGALADFQNPGYKIGFQGEYNFNRKWGVSIGLIHSTVRYTAGPGEYSPSGTILDNGFNPQETRAECILLDIPVKLRYTLTHFNDSRLYTTAGLSTYIMLSEDYRFHYEQTPYTEPVNYNDEQENDNHPYHWSARTGSRHWMSNVSLSLGYELDVHPRISVRAEPFINIPIQEVGWGNVKLYSIGSFFSVSYNL